MRPGKRKKLDKAGSSSGAFIDKIEKLKPGIRAKVEHPFRVVNRPLKYLKSKPPVFSFTR